MIDRIWSGPVVVIASGPSLTVEDVDYCRGRTRVVVVNDNHHMAPWADAMYAADGIWWRHHKGAPGFAGQKWTCDKNAAGQFGLSYVPIDAAGRGYGSDRLHRGGGNSGFQAVNLAMLLGAERIMLVGFDMQPTGGKKHWFGDHPGPLNRNSNYELWRKTMDEAAPTATVEIINCSRETALTAYRRADIRNCL